MDLIDNISGTGSKGIRNREVPVLFVMVNPTEGTVINVSVPVGVVP